MNYTKVDYFSGAESEVLLSSRLLLGGTWFLIAELTLAFGLFLILMVTKSQNWVRKEGNLGGSERTLSKRKIPAVSHFPIKVPTFVNGLYTLYRVQKDGLQFCQEMQAKHGNLFTIALGSGDILVVFDPVVAQKILTSGCATHLDKPRRIYDLMFVSVLRDGLLASEYSVWSTHRKVLSRCFTYRSLQSYLPIMNVHGKSLVNRLMSACSTDKEFSVRGKRVIELVWSETVKIIIQTLMNIDMCSDEDSQKIHDNVKRSKAILQHRFLNPELLIEPIWNIHPLKKALEDCVQLLCTMALQIISKYGHLREMKWTGTEVEEEEDDEVGMKTFRSMIEELLSSGASDKEILDEICTFIGAGHETTSLAINQILFHLACNQNCQKLCREEVDQFFEGVAMDNEMDYNLNMDDLGNLKYLERCILEGLRLTAIVPLFFRQLDSPLEIDEDLTLEGNTTALISPWCIHRDAKNFPDPLKFDPDRFLAENCKERHPYSFIPFSGGQRNCIGYKYAILEIKVILTWLLRHFEITTKDNPDDIRYFMELVLLPDKEVNVVLKKRTERNNENVAAL